ncbi:MAG: hypothetical protein LBB76_10420 [Azoarcus sp.]|nr:hypothetical protein [Azoarcus sp.]
MVDTSLRLQGADLNGLQQSARSPALDAPRERQTRETAAQPAALPSVQVSISEAGRAAIRAETANTPEANAVRPADAVPQRGPSTPVRAPEQAQDVRTGSPDGASARVAVERYLENAADAARPAGQAAPTSVRVAA